MGESASLRAELAELRIRCAEIVDVAKRSAGRAVAFNRFGFKFSVSFDSSPWQEPRTGTAE